MYQSHNFAILVAAGKGLRMGLATKKQYLSLDETPILARTIMAFDICDLVHEIVLVIPEQDHVYCQKNIIDPFGFSKQIHLVEGGAQRQDSVLNGLKKVCETASPDKETIVLIHDGVRPFINQEIIKTCIKTAVEYGACIPAVKITDTIKQADSDLQVEKTMDRQFLYTAQTPQTFKLDLILRAFDHAQKTSFSGTDDASFVEHMGGRVKIINGSKQNIKITTQEDLAFGNLLLKNA